jgi:hypothetical protein
MGLDMWLRAKSDQMAPTDQTGVCSGIFGIVPMEDESHNIELGYWRNAHDQLDLIFDTISGTGNSCDDIRITHDEINTIIKEATRILATHAFDDDGYDISDDRDDYNMCGVWHAKQKWQQTLDYFRAAKELLEKDPLAEIYFCFYN